jgi:exosome complex component RRP4
LSTQAEVQQVFGDGVFALHTRNLRYGKLEHGIMVAVPCALVKRCASHFHRLSCGVHVILGNNGYVWVSPFTSGQDPKHVFLSEEALQRTRPDPTLVNRQLRERVCRVRNCIHALAKQWISVHPASIMDTYEASAEYPVADILRPDLLSLITRPALENQQLALQQQQQAGSGENQ